MWLKFSEQSWGSAILSSKGIFMQMGSSTSCCCMQCRYLPASLTQEKPMAWNVVENIAVHTEVGNPTQTEALAKGVEHRATMDVRVWKEASGMNHSADWGQIFYTPFSSQAWWSSHHPDPGQCCLLPPRSPDLHSVMKMAQETVVPAHSRGVGIRWFFRSLPNQTILWFCERCKCSSSGRENPSSKLKSLFEPT